MVIFSAPNYLLLSGNSAFIHKHWKSQKAFVIFCDFRKKLKILLTQAMSLIFSSSKIISYTRKIHSASFLGMDTLHKWIKQDQEKVGNVQAELQRIKLKFETNGSQALRKRDIQHLIML